MITPKQAQEIKAGIDAGTEIKVVAKDAGVAKSTVERVNRLFIKKGKFAEFLEKCERMASLSAQPKKAKKHSSKKEEITPKMVANMKHLRAQGLPLRKVAERLGLSSNIIWYHTKGKDTSKKDASQKDKLNQKIFAMREKGITVKDIAKKLGVTHGLVHSRVYEHGPSNHSKETTNGASSSVPTSTFSRDIRIGIAFAEVERFIGVLSERLGEPAKVLRPRLSELLGHSPLRQEPGNGD